MAKIFFNKKGIVTEKIEGKKPNREPKKRGVRKPCETFSMSSRINMRKTLMYKDFEEGWKKFSVTLTIPGEILLPEIEVKQWHDFSRVLNSFKWAVIWRKELQERGQVHYHLIIGSIDEINELYPLWWSHLDRITKEKRSEIIGARQFSCKIVEIYDCGQWSRYMQDHMTKYKKIQIARKGRHWGVINRKLFKQSEQGVEYEIGQDIWNKYRRVQRRLFTPFRKNLRSPFGYSLGFSNHRGSSGRSIFFSENSKRIILEKYLQFLIDDRKKLFI